MISKIIEANPIKNNGNSYYHNLENTFKSYTTDFGSINPIYLQPFSINNKTKSLSCDIIHYSRNIRQSLSNTAFKNNKFNFSTNKFDSDYPIVSNISLNQQKISSIFGQNNTFWIQNSDGFSQRFPNSISANFINIANLDFNIQNLFIDKSTISYTITQNGLALNPDYYDIIINDNKYYINIDTTNILVSIENPINVRIIVQHQEKKPEIIDTIIDSIVDLTPIALPTISDLSYGISNIDPIFLDSDTGWSGDTYNDGEDDDIPQYQFHVMNVLPAPGASNLDSFNFNNPRTPYVGSPSSDPRRPYLYDIKIREANTNNEFLIFTESNSTDITNPSCKLLTYKGIVRQQNIVQLPVEDIYTHKLYNIPQFLPVDMLVINLNNLELLDTSSKTYEIYVRCRKFRSSSFPNSWTDTPIIGDWVRCPNFSTMKDKPFIRVGWGYKIPLDNNAVHDDYSSDNGKFKYYRFRPVSSQYFWDPNKLNYNAMNGYAFEWDYARTIDGNLLSYTIKGAGASHDNNYSGGCRDPLANFFTKYYEYNELTYNIDTGHPSLMAGLVPGPGEFGREDLLDAAQGPWITMGTAFIWANEPDETGQDNGELAIMGTVSHDANIPLQPNCQACQDSHHPSSELLETGTRYQLEGRGIWIEPYFNGIIGANEYQLPDNGFSGGTPVLIDNYTKKILVRNHSTIRVQGGGRLHTVPQVYVNECIDDDGNILYPAHLVGDKHAQAISLLNDYKIMCGSWPSKIQMINPNIRMFAENGSQVRPLPPELL